MLLAIPTKGFPPWSAPPSPNQRRPRRPDVNALLHPPRVAAAKLSVTVEQLMGFVRDGELRYVNIGRGKKRDGRTKGDHYPLTLSGVKTRWRRTR